MERSKLYTHNGDGYLVKSVVNGITTYYPSTAYQEEETKITKYYSLGGQKVAMRTNGVLTWLVTDHLGSTNVTANADGSLQSEMRYRAFGETRYTNGITPTDYRYTGQLQQAEVGLYFYNARWYDPQLGRFIQADTLIPGAGNSKPYDRYSYVLNNPINFNDPSGHCYNYSTPEAAARCNAYWEAYTTYAYHTIIAIDFGWNAYSNDLTNDDLAKIYKAGNDISKIVGGNENVRNLYGGRTITKQEMNFGGLTQGNTIWLNSDSSKWDTWTVA